MSLKKILKNGVVMVYYSNWILGIRRPSVVLRRTSRHCNMSVAMGYFLIDNSNGLFEHFPFLASLISFYMLADRRD